MSKVCDEDCFNCKFDDCIMDGLGRAPAPKKELKQDPRNIRRRNYWREHSEELNAKKKSSLCSAQRGDQCQEAEKDKGEKKMQIGDTIKCSSMEEATEYGKQLLAQGWDVKSESDFRTGKWILTITGKKEPKAADDESKYPDMDEMIKACEEKKDPDETIVFAFGVGRMVPLPFDKKAVKKGIEEGLKFIKNLMDSLEYIQLMWTEICSFLTH